MQVEGDKVERPLDEHSLPPAILPARQEPRRVLAAAGGWGGDGGAGGRSRRRLDVRADPLVRIGAGSGLFGARLASDFSGKVGASIGDAIVAIAERNRVEAFVLRDAVEQRRDLQEHDEIAVKKKQSAADFKRMEMLSDRMVQRVLMAPEAVRKVLSYTQQRDVVMAFQLAPFATQNASETAPETETETET